jgi:hypothetical protein
MMTTAQPTVSDGHSGYTSHSAGSILSGAAVAVEVAVVVTAELRLGGEQANEVRTDISRAYLVQ